MAGINPYKFYKNNPKNKVMTNNINKKLNQKLVMTLLARNEEDIIEQCIKFHLSQGVDFIIATDNGSTDNTRNIFLKYQEMGVLHLIDEPEHNYNQDIWVGRMVLLAKKKYKADWVINVDADEFWYCNYGNIKLALPDPKKFNILYVGGIQIDPIDGNDDLFEIPKSISGMVSGIFKCMHTTKGYKKSMMGNHQVKMDRFHKKATTTLDMVIFHFCVRSYKRYETKVITAFKAFENNPRFSDGLVGGHIRPQYEIYKAGKLREEYDRLKTHQNGNVNHIKSDSRLYDWCKNNNSIEKIFFESYKMYNGKNLEKTRLERIRNRLNKLKRQLSKALQ